MSESPLLLVEDDASDELLFERALARSGGGVPLAVARDAEEARAYLGGPGPAPALIVLDLVLRRGSGIEVLEWLRRQPALESIPVIVLTSSRDPSDLARALALGVDRLEAKPSGFPGLRAIVERILARWRDLA